MNKLFNFLMVAIFVTALALSAIGTVPVAAQNINTTDWEDKVYVADFATGKVNAIFEPENPIPVEAPKEVLEALKRGAYLVVIEPYKGGCGGEKPVENVNCNVGFIRSFTDWNDMRDFVYGKSEGNKGHFGPWTHGSFKISFVREMTADEMEIADWAAYMRGEIRVNFAENKPLPAKDPTNGLVNHALSEPWRHGCNGDSTNPNCNVGKSGVGPWAEVLKYLEDGKWTRGSIVAWPKEAPVATAMPSNTPAVTNTPAAGAANGTETVPPTATSLPTFTATPGTVGTPTEEVGVVDAEPTDAVATLPVRPDGANVVIGIIVVLVILAVLALVGIIWAAIANSRKNAAAQQPADNDNTEAEQPAQTGVGDEGEDLDSILNRHRGE